MQNKVVVTLTGPLMVVHWDYSDGLPVTFITLNAEHCLGFSAEDLIKGKVRWTDMVHPDDLKPLLDEIDEGIASNRAWNTHSLYRIVIKDGSEEWVYVLCKAPREPPETGRVIDLFGYVLMLEELCERWHRG